tara:strand:- start:138 stop:482 length:345 start_codon:yes stop_codon:yes gene_type:complete
MIKTKIWDQIKQEPTMSEPLSYEWGSSEHMSHCSYSEDELDKLLASDTQVGGDHYTKLEIQPMTYSMANNLNALQHTALKYITRYQDKGTPLQDLAKARHCIDMMVEDWMDRDG